MTTGNRDDYLEELSRRERHAANKLKAPARHRRMRELLEHNGGFAVMAKKIREGAEGGDIQCLKMMAQYLAPDSKISDATLEGCDSLVGIAPDRRLAMINDRVAAGVLPVEYARVLTELAESELKSQVLKKLRAIQEAIRAGKDPADILLMLAKIRTGDAEKLVNDMPEGFLS